MQNFFRQKEKKDRKERICFGSLSGKEWSMNSSLNTLRTHKGEDCRGNSGNKFEQEFVLIKQASENLYPRQSSFSHSSYPPGFSDVRERVIYDAVLTINKHKFIGNLASLFLFRKFLAVPLELFFL